MEDMMSVVTVRVSTFTTLDFSNFQLPKILSPVASKFKENGVSLNIFTPYVKLTKEQLNLKTKYHAQEIRQLPASKTAMCKQEDAFIKNKISY